MKNLFKISSLMMLTLLVITSCSKNDDASEMPDDQNKKAITQKEMENSANPYDNQGVMYTGFLNTMMEGQDIGSWDVGQLALDNGDLGNWDVGQLAQDNEGDNWDVGQIVSMAMKFNEKNGKASGDEARQSLFMQIEGMSGMGMFSPIDDCLWRPDRCKRLKTSLAALKASNGGTAHDRTLKFISMIRDQEAEILNEDNMEQAEKDVLLISLSIARHSAGYWFNQTRETDVPTDKVSPNMIQLSAFGASTALMATGGSEEAGVGAAILSAYVAAGLAN